MRPIRYVEGRCLLTGGSCYHTPATIIIGASDGCCNGEFNHLSSTRLSDVTIVDGVYVRASHSDIVETASLPRVTLSTCLVLRLSHQQRLEALDSVCATTIMPHAGLNIANRFHAGCTIYSLTFSPDSQWLAIGGWNLVEIWRISTASTRYSLLSCSGVTLAWAPSGNFIVVPTGDRLSLQKWNAMTKSIVSTSPEPHIVDVTTIAYSPDGKQIVSADRRGVIVIWRESDWSAVSIQSRSPVWRVKYSPDGQIVMSDHRGRLCFWDASTGEKLGEVDGDYRDFSFHPNGREFVVTCPESVQIWSVDDFNRRRTFTMHPGLSSKTIQYSADGGRVMSLCLSFEPDELVQTAWDVASELVRVEEFRAMAEWTYSSDYEMMPTSVASDGDGKVAATSRDNEVTIWNLV